MVPSIRKQFNQTFTQEAYQHYLQLLDQPFPGAIDFRVAETPVFISHDFKNKIIETCESIIDYLLSPAFTENAANSIPDHLLVKNENTHCHFLAFDFGICENELGNLEPQLIEMQGFPTLFAYQVMQDSALREAYQIPENYHCYFNGFNSESYLAVLKKIILGQHNAENVILLELFPHQQKTRIDFYCTAAATGIQVLCLTEIIKEGDLLFYIKGSNKIQIKRIYNRIIFDDLQQQAPEIQEKGKILFENLQVEWVPHPNWFYKISKHCLPFINHPFVPKSYFVSQLGKIPEDLSNYVLKPLFSFAGQGVIIDVEQKDLLSLTDPHNWILQKKVTYANCIPTPDIPAKVEIRIFYFWEEGKLRPIATNNLARLSKGKMIGVRYNANKEWVGGSLCYFENNPL